MKLLSFGGAATLALLIAFVGVTTAAMMPGGLGDEKPSDEVVTDVVTPLSDQIKTAAMASLASSSGSGGQGQDTALQNGQIEVLSYKTQVVAGTNYFVKFRMGGMIFHARIYRHFSGTKELTKVVGPKQESDPIEYFQ